MSVEPQKINKKVPELMDLSRKMQDDLRRVFQRNIGIAMMVDAAENPASRLGIGISLSSTATATMMQTLVVALAASLNRPVSAALATLFVLMNDGETPLDKVLERAESLIHLAAANGYDLKPHASFDPNEALLDRLKEDLKRDPELARDLKERMAADPELRERVKAVGLDVEEYLR